MAVTVGAALAGAGAAVKAISRARSVAAKAGKTGPIWSATKKLSPAQNALEHFKKHGAEFGSVNALEYVRDAHAFLRRPGIALHRTRLNGDKLVYNSGIHLLPQIGWGHQRRCSNRALGWKVGGNSASEPDFDASMPRLRLSPRR